MTGSFCAQAILLLAAASQLNLPGCDDRSGIRRGTSDGSPIVVELSAFDGTEDEEEGLEFSAPAPTSAPTSSETAQSAPAQEVPEQAAAESSEAVEIRQLLAERSEAQKTSPSIDSLLSGTQSAVASPYSPPAPPNTLPGGGRGNASGSGQGSPASSGNPVGFFGVDTRALNRVVFIVDISDSMAGPRLQLLKRELKEGIANLAPEAHFSIITFHSVASRWSGMRAATDSNKAEAARFIDSLQTGSDTNLHLALAEALTFRSDCETFILLTDGEPSCPESEVHAKIHQFPPMVLHTISFEGGAKASQLMRAIATQTGGSFREAKLKN